MGPKVSVIIPTYNSGCFLIETINSVLNQSFKDYEIIVIDDGSTDETSEVIKNFKDVKTINYIFQKNKGVGSARNLGINNSIGEYIAVLDADDLWLPDKLLLQIRYMDRNPEVGLTFTNAIAFVEKNGIKEKMFEWNYPYEHVPLKTLLMFNPIPCSSVVIRKEYFKNVGLFDEDRVLMAVADYDLWLRICKSYKIGAIREFLTMYRIHPKNMIGDDADKGLKFQIKVIKNIFRQYPELEKEIGIKKKQLITNIYTYHAKERLNKGEHKKAKKYFIQALKYRPFSVNAWRQCLKVLTTF